MMDWAQDTKRGPAQNMHEMPYGGRGQALSVLGQGAQRNLHHLHQRQNDHQ